MTLSKSQKRAQRKLDFMLLAPGESYCGEIGIFFIKCADGRVRAFTTDSAKGFGLVPAGDIEQVVRGLGYVVDATTRLVLER